MSRYASRRRMICINKNKSHEDVGSSCRCETCGNVSIWWILSEGVREVCYRKLNNITRCMSLSRTFILTKVNNWWHKPPFFNTNLLYLHHRHSHPKNPVPWIFLYGRSSLLTRHLFPYSYELSSFPPLLWTGPHYHVFWTLVFIYFHLYKGCMYMYDDG